MKVNSQRYSNCRIVFSASGVRNIVDGRAPKDNQINFNPPHPDFINIRKSKEMK